jgi:hypothetical protein
VSSKHILLSVHAQPGSLSLYALPPCNSACTQQHDQQVAAAPLHKASPTTCTNLASMGCVCPMHSALRTRAARYPICTRVIAMFSPSCLLAVQQGPQPLAHAAAVEAPL